MGGKIIISSEITIKSTELKQFGGKVHSFIFY